MDNDDKKPAGEAEVEPDQAAEANKDEEVVTVDESGKETEDKPADKKEEEDKPKDTAKAGGLKGFWQKYKANKKWSIPLTILILLAILLIIPFTRYEILGIFIKEQYSVKVVDAKTGDPVSSADINLAGVTAKSDGEGKATVKVKLGHEQLLVTKKYYADSSQKVTVTLSKSSNNSTVQLSATGRLVPVTLTNKIDGKPVSDATFKVSDTEGKTDQSGTANIALPADKPSLDAVISAKGYNDTKVTIKITDQADKANNFTITPSGKVYFLSKATGKIDVVKTNLDGTDRKTVYAGTGNESDTDTVMLASRDWHYLALKSRRSGKLASLYLIDTTSDKVTTMDEGDADFQMVGWDDNYFVYQVTRNNVKEWKPNKASIKSYNAQTGQISVLDNTNASGNSADYSTHETYATNPYIFDHQVVFAKGWTTGQYDQGAAGKQNTLTAINSNGSNKSVLGKLDSTKAGYISIYQPKVDQLLIQAYNYDKSTNSYYTYNTAGTFKEDKTTDYSNSDFNYPTYLLSPNGKMVFWYEERDGKDTLFTSNLDGSNKITVGSLTEYNTYGWYTDTYLLISKSDSELYILPNQEIKDKQPLKITDYHKPAANFNGYGGGYGGPH